MALSTITDIHTSGGARKVPPAFHAVLWQQAQWEETQLASQPIQGRAHHQLFQKQIHIAGTQSTLYTLQCINTCTSNCVCTILLVLHCIACCVTCMYVRCSDGSINCISRPTVKRSHICRKSPFSTLYVK